MDRKNGACFFGDCPGLDGGPKSREHEMRFLNRGGASVNADSAPTFRSDTSKNGAGKRETAK